MILRILFVILSIGIFPHLLFGQVLIDKENGNPIPYAQIVDEKGVTVGISNMQGMLSLQKLKDGKLVVQHISYYPKELTTADLKSRSRIFLIPKSYTLNDVSISFSKKDYIHLRAYFRSYQLNDSCLKYYRDGFVDFFIRLSNKKIKRYISQIRNLGNDSLIAGDRKRANRVVDKYISIPYLEQRTLIENLKRKGWTFEKDTVVSTLYRNGVYGGIVKRDADNKTCLITYDVLSGMKEKTASLFGYTTRLDCFLQTETYRYKEDFQSYVDLINRKWYRKIFYKYKKDEKEQMVEVFDELYVLAGEYVSTDSVKNNTEKLETVVFSYPDDSIVTPLSVYQRGLFEKYMKPIE